MYYRGTAKENKKPPFEVICTNCGSHNVDVTALEYYDLQISCRNCGSYLSYGSYNEIRYEE